MPIGSVQEIQMPMGDVVDKVLVKDGEKVKSNQILVKLDTEATTQRLKSVEINLRLKRRQLELKKIEFNQYTKLNEDSVKTLTGKVDYEKKSCSISIFS